MNRELSGVFFRIERDGKWQSIDFSDMTAAERGDVLKGKDELFLKNLCNVLADALHDMGEELDVSRCYE